MARRAAGAGAAKGTISIRNASSGARLSASHASPGPTGPTSVPSVNVAVSCKVCVSAALPRKRTRRPRIGSAMPRLPQKSPPCAHGESHPRPSTAWYSISSTGTSSRFGDSAKPSIQRWLPGSPTQSPSRASTSPWSCTWAAISGFSTGSGGGPLGSGGFGGAGRGAAACTPSTSFVTCRCGAAWPLSGIW